jgi:hypothetical protein
MAIPQRDLVTIDNSVIDQMLTDPRIASLIPCLRSPPRMTQRRDCNKCSSGTQDVDYGMLKTCLATLDTASLAHIKRYFNARRVRVYRPSTKSDGRAVTIKHTR